MDTELDNIFTVSLRFFCQSPSKQRFLHISYICSMSDTTADILSVSNTYANGNLTFDYFWILFLLFPFPDTPVCAISKSLIAEY